MTLSLTPEQVNQIAEVVAARIQGNNGAEHETTLALIEYKVDQQALGLKAHMKSQSERWKLFFKDHDELTHLKSQFGLWRGILGAFQTIGTVLGIWLGKGP